MVYRVGKASIVETLLFGEHGRIATFEVDVCPPKALPSLVAPISQYLRATHAGVRQQVDERTVTAGFDRCLSILTNSVNRSAGLLVDEAGELLAILGGPGLLVAALVATIVGNRFGGVAPLGDVLGEMSLANGPAAERRDVRVVGADCACSPALAGEVTGVLAEVTRVKLLE
jgi:hypothetical protein